jgi:hypothetical protein
VTALSSSLRVHGPFAAAVVDADPGVAVGECYKCLIDIAAPWSTELVDRERPRRILDSPLSMRFRVWRGCR